MPGRILRSTANQQRQARKQVFWPVEGGPEELPAILGSALETTIESFALTVWYKSEWCGVAGMSFLAGRVSRLT